MSTALVPMEQMNAMALSIAKSGLFGAKTPDQAMAIMLLAQAEGLHPATAARDYHIIEGKPALKADAMLARHLQSGGTVKWNDYSDAKVSGTFSHPQGGTVTVDWDDARVKQAGLSERPNHKKFPRQMKRARVISEGVRTVNPGIAVGLYTPEEMQDLAAVPERDMGNAEVVEDGPTNWAQLLTNAPTLGQLGEVWAQMTPAEKKEHQGTKDARKIALSPPDDFASDYAASEKTL